MANEQNSEWQNNKEMNIKENSSATDEGISITDENQEQSWREPQAADQGEGGEAQSGFGEGTQSQSASAGAGQGGLNQSGTQGASDPQPTPGNTEDDEDFQR
jgi:hypothetical protein